ncbi:DUF4189 domain-containing protein [Variovorax sp. LT1R16]|uniref:DUF4189 domain-containing protein n=1 Tax=Variovorax sp. LT1R16 TaxID=3443728 RepID=UPI003F472622
MTVLLCANLSAAHAAPPAAATPNASWGAIAAKPGVHGYAFNQPSRASAERLARAQCERATGAKRVPGACEVRVYFDRSCGALATGNFGEWAGALGADSKAAGQAAVTACDAHLPTEPCKLAVSVCSLP